MIYLRKILDIICKNFVWAKKFFLQVDNHIILFRILNFLNFIYLYTIPSLKTKPIIKLFLNSIFEFSSIKFYYLLLHLISLIGL